MSLTYTEKKSKKREFKMKQKVIDFLIKVVKYLKAKDHEIRIGTVKKVINTNFKKHRLVLTNEGLAKIGTGTSSSVVVDTNNKTVSIISINDRSAKMLPINSVFSLEVIDEDSFISYPLHPCLYKYVAHAVNKKVKYHLSKEKNALLTQKEVERLQLFAVLNSSRGGQKIINTLKRKGLFHLLLNN
jgi:hypothetical protein